MLLPDVKTEQGLSTSSLGATVRSAVEKHADDLFATGGVIAIDYENANLRRAISDGVCTFQSYQSRQLAQSSHPVDGGSSWPPEKSESGQLSNEVELEPTDENVQRADAQHRRECGLPEDTSFVLFNFTTGHVAFFTYRGHQTFRRFVHDAQHMDWRDASHSFAATLFTKDIWCVRIFRALRDESFLAVTWLACWVCCLHHFGATRGFSIKSAWTGKRTLPRRLLCSASTTSRSCKTCT